MEQRFLVFLLSSLLLIPFLSTRAQPLPDGNHLKKQLKQSRSDSSRVRILINLVNWHINRASDRSIQHVDSALIYAGQAEVLSHSLGYKQLVGESLMAKSEALIDARGDRKTGKVKARILLAEALRIFRKTTDKLHWADAMFLMADSYGTKDTTKIPYLKAALRAYREVNDRKRIAKALTLLGTTNRMNGLFPEALRRFLEAAVIQPVQNEEYNTLWADISLTYKSLGDYPKALQYAYQSYQKAKQVGNRNQMAMSSRVLGDLNGELGDPKAQLHYYHEALEQEKQLNNYQRVVKASQLISMTLLQLGKNQEALDWSQKAWKMARAHAKIFEYSTMVGLGDCYSAMQDYTKAEWYYRHAMPHYSANSEGIIEIYQGLATVYMRTQRLTEAVSFLNRAYENIRQLGNDPAKQREVVLALYRIDSLRGQYQSALARYRQYTALNDLLSNDIKNKQIASLQIQFDTEKKEQAIKLLQQEKKLDQNRIANAQTTQNVTIAGGLMLIVLLGVSYNRYRLKQRTNQQLEAKQLVIDQKNRSLQNVLSEKEHLLEEREWMLKEIHHRVKNNLQVISSMLNSQFDFLHDPTALAAIRESQSRVQVMALIHQKLYMSDSLAQIGMQEYIHEIVDYLIESFDRQNTVGSALDVADLHFDVALATPLGLIINEAVTNSLKYAFPQNRKGTVSIGLVALADETYRLTMSDDGIGLPANFDFERSNTLGLTMIRGLSKQIKGQLTISQENGVEISLQFSMAKKPLKTGLKTA